MRRKKIGNLRTLPLKADLLQGVIFHELSTAGKLLEEKVLEPELKEKAVDIIHKIEGTELFDLLENFLGDISKRIADLLSASISKNDRIVSFNQGDSSDSFDIGEFV